MGIFAALFAYYGIGYAEFGAMQTSMMLQINMVYINMAVPFCGICWSVFSVFRLWQLFQNYKVEKGAAHA